MAGTAQQTKPAIKLKGSTDIIAEYFHYGINSILYQRGIYQPESFTRERKYDLTLLVTTDETLKNYMSEVINQVKVWLNDMTVRKLVLLIKENASNEVVERWQFDIECDKSFKGEENTKTSNKSEAAIKGEIMGVIRQITASVSFLPLLDCQCAFDILVYTDKDLEVPETWGESGPGFINNSEEVKFRSISTIIHKVDTMVSFKR